MAQPKLFFVGVKGLIESSKHEILLLKADVTKHRGNIEPYWDIPGGRIDEGENDVLATIRREILEETGVDATEDITFLTAVI